MRRFQLFMAAALMLTCIPVATYGQAPPAPNALLNKLLARRGGESDEADSDREPAQTKDETADSDGTADSEEASGTDQQVLNDTPERLFDMTPKIRTPERKDRESLGDAVAEERVFKQISFASDHFHHGPLLFEEPGLERFGLSHPPKRQLAKSTALFFGRGYLFPARLLLGHQKGCDSSEGWGDLEGRKICPTCKD